MNKGAGEKAPWLKALVALPEDTTTLGCSQPPVTPVSGDPAPSPHATGTYTHMVSTNSCRYTTLHINNKSLKMYLLMVT